MAVLAIDKDGRATFPDEVCNELGLGADGIVVLLERTPRGTYELVPVVLIPTDQLWFYSAAIQSRIAEAEADFREGRFTSAATPTEVQAYLDGLKNVGSVR